MLHDMNSMKASENNSEYHHSNLPIIRPRPRKKSNNHHESDIFMRRNMFHINYLEESSITFIDSNKISKDSSVIVIDDEASEHENNLMENCSNTERAINVIIYPPFIHIKSESSMKFSMGFNESFQNIFLDIRKAYHSSFITFMYDMVQVSDWATPNSLLVNNNAMTLYTVLEEDISRLSLKKYESWCDYIQNIDIASQSKNLQVVNILQDILTLSTIELSIKGPKGFKLILSNLNPHKCTISEIEQMISAKSNITSVASRGMSFYFDGDKLANDKTLEALQLQDKDCIEVYWKI